MYSCQINVVNFRDLQTWMHINTQLHGYHVEFLQATQTDPEVIWKTIRRTLKIPRHHKLLFLTKQWQTDEQTGSSIIWSDCVRQAQSARWNLALKLRLACLRNMHLSCYSAMPLTILFSSKHWCTALAEEQKPLQTWYKNNTKKQQINYRRLCYLYKH